MAIFSGGYAESTDSGLMKLWCMKQLLICIAQEEGAFNELDSYSMLGLTMILNEVGYEIETHHDKISDALEASKKRHAKLRADIAALKESGGPIGGSDLAQILEADEEETHD